jgi:hypothetical protein
MDVIAVKIDMDKILEKWLFQGKKGTYLDVILLPAKGGVDKYGNHYMAVQGIDQASREAGEQGSILGNAKILAGRGGKKHEERENRSTPATATGGYRRRSAPPARVQAESHPADDFGEPE